VEALVVPLLCPNTGAVLMRYIFEVNFQSAEDPVTSADIDTQLAAVLKAYRHWSTLQPLCPWVLHGHYSSERTMLGRHPPPPLPPPPLATPSSQVLTRITGAMLTPQRLRRKAVALVELAVAVAAAAAARLGAL